MSRRPARPGAAVALAGMLLAACTHGTQRARVEDAVRGYLDAFARRDATGLAAYYDSSCHVDPATLRAEFAPFAHQRLAVDVRTVDVQLLSSTTANATATGTLTVGHQEVPLTGPEGTQQFHLVVEGGAWKIANCPAPAG